MEGVNGYDVTVPAIECGATPSAHLTLKVKISQSEH